MALLNVPAGHSDGASAPAPQTAPGGHLAHAWPFAYVPAGQIPQTLAVVLCTWPPGHSQTEAPGALSLPAGQVALAVPLPSPQLPAAHLWQAVDTPCFSKVSKHYQTMPLQHDKASCTARSRRIA